MHLLRAFFLLFAVGLVSAADPRTDYDLRVRQQVAKRWDDVSTRFENTLESGTAVIRFVIAPDGQPGQVRTTSAQGAPNLIRITKEMIEQMKFPPLPPAMLKQAAKGVPVEISLTVLP